MNTSRMAFSFIIMGLPLWLTSLTTRFVSTAPFTLDVEIVGAEEKICKGDSVTLEAVVSNGEGPFTYKWFDSHDFSGEPIGTGAFLRVAPDSTQFYCVEAFSANDRGKDKVTVGVKPLPTIKIIDLYCDPGPEPRTYKVEFRSISEEIEFLPAGDYSVTRQGEFGYIVGGIPSGDSLTIRARFTSTGCENELTVGFTCPDCYVEVDIEGDSAVCPGGTANLTARASGSAGPFFYQWFDNPDLEGDAINTDSVLSVPVTTATTYYVKAIQVCDDTLLTAVDSAMIDVLPEPLIAVVDTMCIEGRDSYCVTIRTDADSLSFLLGRLEGPQVGDLYTVCDIPIEATQKFTAINTMTGCTKDLEFLLPAGVCTRDSCPEVSVEIARDTAICLGGTATLVARPSGGEGPYSFDWFDNADLIGPPLGTGNILTVNPMAATTYFVKVTLQDTVLCKQELPMAVDSASVDVLPVPEMIVVDTFCECPLPTYCVRVRTDAGMVMTLPRPYPVDFIETDGDFSIFDICGIPSDSTVTVLGVNLGTPCKAEIGITKSCLSVDIVTDNDLPEELNLSVCSGDCIDLEAEAKGGNPPYSYTWYDSRDRMNGPIGTGPTVQVCPTTPTWYYVVANDTAAECVENPPVDSVLVEISNTMVEIITEPAEICEGDTIRLTAEAMGGTSPYTFEWYDNSALMGTPAGTGESIEVSPAGTTTYYVTAAGQGENCPQMDVDSVRVTVNQNPTITLLGTLCEQGGTYCIAVFTNGDSVKVMPDGVDVGPSNGGIVEICGIPIGTDTDVEVCFSQTQCCSMISVPSPSDSCSLEVEITNPKPTEICCGEEVELVARASGCNAPFTYEWYDNPGFSGTPLSTNPTLLVSPLDTAVYYVVANDTDTDECVTGPAVDSIQVNALPKPELTIDSVFCLDVEPPMVKVLFTSNTESLVPSSGQIEAMGGDQYMLTVDTMDSVSITATLSNSICAITVNLSLPDCPCTLDVDIIDPEGEGVSICSGDMTLLMAAATGSNPPFTYEWYEG